jgi:hypothetical protein
MLVDDFEASESIGAEIVAISESKAEQAEKVAVVVGHRRAGSMMVKKYREAGSRPFPKQMAAKTRQ